MNQALPKPHATTTGGSERGRAGGRGLGPAILAVATGLLLIANAGYRWLIHRCLAVTFSVYDPYAHDMPIDFGPAGPDSTTAQTPGELEELLSDWFPGDPFSVVVFHKQDLATPADAFFQHEHLAHRRVQEFRIRAADLNAGDPDLFLLCQRVRNLTVHGSTRLPRGDSDPLVYLQAARDREPLNCRYFAVIYTAACVARGYTARLIGLSADGTSFWHAVAEVYAPELGKWIVIDPDFNIAYRRGSEWLDARQLHEAWLRWKWRPHRSQTSGKSHRDCNTRRENGFHCGDEVELVELGAAGRSLRDTNMYASSPTGMLLEYYEYVFYPARNDYLSGTYPAGHPKRSTTYVLQAASKSGLPAVCPEGYRLRSREQVYWPVGRTAVFLRGPVEDTTNCMLVELATWTPNFRHFEVRYDDGAWAPHLQHTLCWRLRTGGNSLWVRSVNAAGLCGEASRVRISRTPRRSAAAKTARRPNHSGYPRTGAGHA